MKMYSIKVTPDAKADLRKYLSYINNKLKNPQAAKNVADDFIKTKDSLKNLAGSLAEPDSEKLKDRGLKRISFMNHDYFLLYRVKGNRVEITNMFHGSEDYESKLR
ncbi:MAG: type II toxin-antitoxin system RelE/ParE family toxin [Lachnospiraceae bacterium]|nr:type II toxin-antitoxin system RelE/ParE family toxin [Lachnospiraceae bacterium]